MDSRTASDRWLSPEVVRFVAGVSLAIVAMLVVVQFTTNRRGQTAFGTPLGADYGEFYAVGLLLNEGPGDRLYDLDLQDEWLHRTLPSLPEGEHLPFAYPPFLAVLFRPLARLPFAWSFATWLAISLAAYVASVALMLRGSGSFSGPETLTAWLVALSFEPFAMECWLGGQLSALGCLAVATGLACRRAGRPWLSGVALAGLLYKPTLLVLVLPLLVAGRRWRTLGGFAVGAALLATASLLASGVPGCLDFVGLMAGYGRQGGSLGDGFRTMKYVDLGAFFRLIGIGPAAAITLAAVLGAPALFGLISIGARSDRGGGANLAWSAALCWTPVLTVYGPIYDVTLVVPGLILAADTLRGKRPSGWTPSFRWLLAIVYLSALFSPAMARGLGVQPLTIALAAMGTYLLRASLRSSGSASSRMP